MFDPVFHPLPLRFLSLVPAVQYSFGMLRIPKAFPTHPHSECSAFLMCAVRDASRLARPMNAPPFGMLCIPHVRGQRRFASCPPHERERNSPEMQAFHSEFRSRSWGAEQLSLYIQTGFHFNRKADNRSALRFRASALCRKISTDFACFLRMNALFSMEKRTADQQLHQTEGS